ncbi:hypothetical protein KTI63_02160 [Acinetobacter guillouiae]|uniref:hypothetical protein n=1 Tax=Acinetobacter guillouiae TaxID=106649 RepID=UPI0021D32C1D|nr:hypothetical protein [Acinetobacter guillouiae]MCU4491269.1 hypothetical protein [Acinetobacter guillouiae]
MNSRFQTIPDHKQSQQIQSFYEPTLELLESLHEIKKNNLRMRGYNEENAAVTKEELAQKMAYRFKITIWLSHQVITSLIKAEQVISFGGYVKPKVGEL